MKGCRTPPMAATENETVAINATFPLSSFKKFQVQAKGARAMNWSSLIFCNNERYYQRLRFLKSSLVVERRGTAEQPIFECLCCWGGECLFVGWSGHGLLAGQPWELKRLPSCHTGATSFPLFSIGGLLINTAHVQDMHLPQFLLVNGVLKSVGLRT